eukprot:10745201-Ditylum_brightwellii.AAC.1
MEEIDGKIPPPLIYKIKVTAFVNSEQAHDKVMKSTYGAEFCATRTAVEEVQAIQYMLRCLGVKKHVAIAYHKTREAASSRTIHPIKMASANNLADLLTK